MGQGEGHHLRHRGMVHQHPVDFQRGNLLAAAVDDLFQPAGQRQIAIAIQLALIAGPEPAQALAIRPEQRLRQPQQQHADRQP